MPAFPRHPQNRFRDSLKTVEVQTILLEVQTGTNEVQTIGIGFVSRFGGGGAGDMDLYSRKVE